MDNTNILWTNCAQCKRPTMVAPVGGLIPNVDAMAFCSDECADQNDLEAAIDGDYCPKCGQDNDDRNDDECKENQ